ncbi:glycosyl transferase [Bacterioplanes sanyensis]|uniref:glycosyltransferase family 2 protein n=1 Tax=Bacterioplanes sanyensis TaxID=1249553 RepID=UPI0016766251|nr:glycosyltransferase [Bacterioplanes sanyensis]GGY35847.1 glycosyl transferase [Bacterioplanes sanyensis]
MSNTAPLVSICMPAYNCAATIDEAIGSVVAQSWRQWELLVVDDGSSDDTAQRVKAWQDGRIRLLRHNTPSGSPARPRNTALAQARGRYIAFLDADDLWLPVKLERQLEFMRTSAAAISCCGYRRFDASGQKSAVLPPLQASYDDLLRQNTAGCLTVMLDREQLPTFEFPACGHEDYALWLSLLRRGETMLGLPEILACYRLQAGSVSSSPLRNVAFLWHIYQQREQLGWWRSLTHIVGYAWRRQQRYQQGN